MLCISASAAEPLIETVLQSSLEISLEDDVRILSREPSEDVDKSLGWAAGMLLPEVHQLLVGHHAHHPLGAGFD